MREAAREEQRRILEGRLREAKTLEKGQRQLFDEDVARFVEAVGRFFSSVAPYLPKTVGGAADEPHLPGGVLFAENPALKLERLPAGAASVTMRLRGPLRFRFAGLEMAVVGSGQTLSLVAGDEQRPLEPRMLLGVGRQEIVAFAEGGYLHFKRLNEARSFAALTAEAFAVLCCVRPTATCWSSFSRRPPDSRYENHKEPCGRR